MVRAAALEDAYTDWRVSVEDARLVARHRHESYDAHREMWGMVAATVHATTPEQMHDRLEAQQAYRWAKAEVRG